MDEWTKKWFDAVKNKNLEVMEYMLSRGTEVDTYDSDGRTALINACAYKDLETIKFLVLKGADVYKQSYGDFTTPLMMTSSVGFYEGAVFIAEQGPENMDVRNYRGYTAFICACGSGSLDIVKKLYFEYPQGIRKTARDTCGRDCFMLAAENGHEKVLLFLLSDEYFFNKYSSGDSWIHIYLENNSENMNTDSIDFLTYFMDIQKKEWLPDEYLEQNLKLKDIVEKEKQTWNIWKKASDKYMAARNMEEYLIEKRTKSECELLDSFDR